MKFSLENIGNIRQLINHLSSGLKRLNFTDNFEGTEISITIASGAEVQVRNPLNYIPTRYIVLEQTGNSTISKSNTWTTDFIYFTNFGAAEGSYKIRLLR